MSWVGLREPVDGTHRRSRRAFPRFDEDDHLSGVAESSAEEEQIGQLIGQTGNRIAMSD